MEAHHGTNEKENSKDLWKTVVDQAEKDYKTTKLEFGLHRSTVRQILSKWRKFKTIVNLPSSGQPTLHHEKTKQQSVNGRAAGRKSLLFNKNISAYLPFAKDHVDEPDSLSCGRIRPKQNFLFKMRSIMVWALFTVCGLGGNVIIDGTMNSEL